MASFSRAARRIKNSFTGLGEFLDPRLVEEVFRHCGHEWRDRLLSPAPTLDLLLRQVLRGNIPCAEVRHLSAEPDRGPAFTASAYCQARARLPVAGVWKLCCQVTSVLRREFAEAGEAGRWRGHRTFHIDGTGFSMPDTPGLRAAFGQPGRQRLGCGFPVGHLLILFDAATGMALEAIPAPLRTHDLRHAALVHPHLHAGDVLVGDCAFGSWGHLALLERSGLHGVFGMHQARKAPRGGGPNFDRLERWPKPAKAPAWMDGREFDDLPDQITVRVIGRRIKRPGGWPPVNVVVVTTLTDSRAHPADAVIALHKGRWEAEVDIRHLKTTMGMRVLRCRTVDGVLRELAAFLLIYNLVRAVMVRAGCRQGVEPGRISFIDALRWVRHTGVDALLCDLVINPHRPGRIEARAVKRRHDEHRRMNRPREELRNAMKKQAKAA